MVDDADRVRAALMGGVCAAACAALDARATSVAVVDEPAGEFVFVATRGGEADLVGARFRITQGIAGRALAAGEPVVVADTSRDPGFARDIAVATGFEPDALAVFPLLLEGRIAAVLSVLDPGAGLGREALAVMAALADHAASGLALAAELRRRATRGS